MKRNNSLFLIAALFLAASLVSAQPPIAWDQTYGGPDWDYCYSVHQTADGYIYLKGATDSYGAGERDLFLVKADSMGNQLWYQTYGGSEWEGTCHKIHQNQDNSIIIGGYTASFGVSPHDFYLVKTDLDGTELWSNTYGTVDNDKCYGVTQIDDGSYIMCGVTNYGLDNYDIYLVKVDTDGNLEWTQTHGYSDVEWCYDVRQTSDGGYIVAGYTRSLGVYDDGYLLKTDYLGNIEWDQNYAGNSWDYFFEVMETLDGGYIAAGYSDISPGGPAQMWAVKTDALGNQQWNHSYGGSAEDRCYSLQLSPDGGYFLCGGTTATASGLYDMWLIKIDAQGNIEWDETYGDDDDELCRSLLATENGGFFLGGYKVPYGGGDCNMYLMRLEDESIPEIELTLTLHNPPIQIPSGGGNFQFDIEIVNTSTGWCTIDIWTNVTSPGGYTFPIVQKDNIVMSSGQIIYRQDLIQFVPGTASAGMYSYNAYAWDNSMWTVYAEDSFPFEKLAGDYAPSHDFGWSIFGWDEESSPVVSVPFEFSTVSARPNPFNPTTAISYQLSAVSYVNLAVYDVSGRKVVDLVNGWRDAGVHEVTFDGSKLASGIYIYRLNAGGYTTSGKMVLMK